MDNSNNTKELLRILNTLTVSNTHNPLSPSKVTEDKAERNIKRDYCCLPTDHYTHNQHVTHKGKLHDRLEIGHSKMPH